MIARLSGVVGAMFLSATASALPIGTEFFAGGRAGVQAAAAPGSFFQDSEGTASAAGTAATGAASLDLAGSGGVLTGSAQFESDLSTGTLRALAELPEFPDSDALYGTAFAAASFGDSFTHLDGDEPFIFSEGAVSTFRFDIDGITGRSNAEFQSAAWLYLFILEEGSLGQVVNDQGGIFCCGNPDLVDNVIEWTAVGFTPDSNLAVDLTDPSFGDVPISVIAGGTFEYSFNPQGNFDWWVELGVASSFNSSNTLQPTGNSVITDYYNTITASYVGPAGSTVQSASGVFPVQAVAVPEPGTLGLLAAGVLGLSLARRRWQR